MRGERTREDLAEEVGSLREQIRTADERAETFIVKLDHYKTRAVRAETLLAALADKLAAEA